MNYENVIVKKPWGQEYLCYHNNNVAIWFLHIKEGQQTSMHCHPNKNTGFVVLQGKTFLSFLRGGVEINGLNKINIFRSRFHSTKALTDAYIFEIETPEDKGDLVRLEDNYGRVGKKYEGSSHHENKTEECFWLEEASIEPEGSYLCGCEMKHIIIEDKQLLLNKEETEMIVITGGGLVTKEGQNILWPGDVIDGKSLERLANKFELGKNTTILSIIK